jgi:single-stranded DNA-specific DHH superfamily exonuclease
MAARGIEPDSLKASLQDLPDEKLLANIDAVAERIREAMYNNEPMVIFGHDDPDGVTSTYILYHFLNSCGYQKHAYYIPNRNIERMAFRRISLSLSGLESTPCRHCGQWHFCLRWSEELNAWVVT